MPESNADFAGQIELDVRDSVPDWSPYELRKAPDGAPNVLVVLYDDTGLASWSPYGGRISMPTMDCLARRTRVHAVAHDGAVLPDPIDHAHRSKPPREPRRGHHGGHQRVPRIRGTPAGGVRDDRPDPAAERLLDLLGGQGPQRPGRGQRPRRGPIDVAPAARLRSDQGAAGNTVAQSSFTLTTV